MNPRDDDPKPERAGPTSTAPQPGERDRPGARDGSGEYTPDPNIDPHSGKERHVDGTYGGLQPAPQATDAAKPPARAGASADAGGRETPVPAKEGTHAYAPDHQRADDPGAPPTGSTVESGSGRADRM